MEPVAKLSWVGEIEKEITSYSSWVIPNFISKRDGKTVTKETAKIYYEIDFDIEFHDSIDEISDRYDELLKNDRKFTHLTNKSNENKWAWNREETWNTPSKEGTEGKQLGFVVDADKDKDQEVPYKSILDGLKTIKDKDEMFGKIIAQDHRFDKGFSAALTLVHKDILEDILSDEDKTIAKEYPVKATAKIQNILLSGTDIVADALEEYFIEEYDFAELLEEMLDSLEKTDSEFTEKFIEEIGYYILKEGEASLKRKYHRRVQSKVIVK